MGSLDSIMGEKAMKQKTREIVDNRGGSALISGQSGAKKGVKDH